jgi:hypothetical protein
MHRKDLIDIGWRRDDLNGEGAHPEPQPKLSAPHCDLMRSIREGFISLGEVNIPRQSEQGFHGKKNTNSTAKLMPIPRQKEQGFHAIANRVSGWRRRGSTVARSTVLSGVPNGKCQVDHAQNQGSAAAAFRV